MTNHHGHPREARDAAAAPVPSTWKLPYLPAKRVLRAKLLLVLAAAAVALPGCSKHTQTKSLTSPVTTIDPTSPGSSTDRYTIAQTLSDECQRNTIAFDGLAFLTGSLGAQSFLPPGKVADFSGFQYLRDNDPTDLGHNTDFVTIVAYNMLTLLTPAQVAQLVASAQVEAQEIDAFAYHRFPLLKAFRREFDGDRPTGTTGLDSSAVVAYTAGLYRLDGQISYSRARLMGGILHSLSTEQQAALAALKARNGVGNWDRTLADPLQSLHLAPNVGVAVMTYASEMYAWWAGSIEADVYFCPERQGTYFGSFYLKDWPAMGNPDYSINEQLTASAGQDFLNALPAPQSALVSGLVDVQRNHLLEIVQRRRDIATLLRGFIAGQAVDSATVIALSARYGELDGALSYSYATRFSNVAHALTTAQKAQVTALATALGYATPTGAFLYSAPVAMPAIENTDFLFGSSGGSTSSFVLSSSAVTADTLPVRYTCDGAGVSPPVKWSGAPSGTQSYAVVMHHVDPEGAIKWYWVLYDIPASVTSLREDVSGIGTLGNNSVNGNTAYAPPCSQGPGAKTYVITVYALSATPEIAVAPSAVSREVLLAAIADHTLATAQMSVTYTRP
jgi:Raf kinase inhibitor-like YbhB/YbcL family protein